MKRTLYVLALGIFGIATTEFGVIGILPQLSSAFHVSIDKAGWLLSTFALIIALFGPFMMMLASSFDRKKILAFVLAIFAVSNMISALSPSFNVLLIARILPAFLHPVFWSIGLATAANSVPPGQSPKAVSIVFAGFTIASVFGIPLATFVADIFNWQTSFILSAFINTISFAGLVWLLPQIPAPEKNQAMGQVSIFRKRMLWINLVLACLMISAMYSTYGYMAVYLEQITKMRGGEISLMLLLFGVAGVGGNWLAGKYLSKNIDVTTLIFIVLLAIVHLLLFFFGSYFIPMILMVFFWGLVHTGGFLISNVNVTSSATEAPEFVNSIFTSCGNLAVTIGSTIGGLTIAKTGIHQVPLTSIILLILSLCVLFLKTFKRFSLVWNKVVTAIYGLNCKSEGGKY
ncbi:MFS transporter [Pedobacter caeni]|uniref:Predicted arabinose efflux permease, MFS family n=1 Tax=Pedobacter caeni TaxID=288992 RepID=A0A1M5F180_9SPHI|nr:MFS transporter [Pedobacter caeni]SHF85285.1 Predicted arabinose efflux permease, MFS family [Pedobacter caeni]